MDEQEHTYREVTIYIRDNETFEEYMQKARDAYFMEEDYKNLMSEPQIPFEEILKELDEILLEETKRMNEANCDPCTIRDAHSS